MKVSLVVSDRDLLGDEISRYFPGGVVGMWERDHEGRPTAHHVRNNDRMLSSVGYHWTEDSRISAMIDAQHGATQYQHPLVGNLRGMGAIDIPGREKGEEDYVLFTDPKQMLTVDNLLLLQTIKNCLSVNQIIHVSRTASAYNTS